MPTIKVGLTGDCHFNVPRRSEEAKRVLNWMLMDWKVRGVHLIGIGGDLADGPMTERERAWLIDYITRASLIAPVIVDGGNHEVELALQNALGNIPNVIVEEGAGVYRVETAAGPIAVACVSFPKKAALLALVGRPVSGEEAEQIAGQALQDVFRGLGVKLKELQSASNHWQDMPCVALVHGTIKGSKVQPDDQPDRPLGLDIALPDLTLMGADFYCTPHIHLAQEWEYNGVTIATPSSPFYTDYGEAKHFKGYILAQFDGGSPEHVARIKNVIWERIPTPATPMILIEGTWTDEPPMIVIDGGRPSDDTLEGADVRFRFHFPADKREAAKSEAEGWARLVKEGRGVVNVTLDPVLIPTTRSRIPALATTVRLEDKLRLYWQSIGFEPTPERDAALMEALHELQDAAAVQGLAMGTTGRTAPSLKKVRGKGWLKFPNEFELNFQNMEGPLHAIIAPNEMGKSVLMQIMGPGLLYGKTPTRGSLDDLSIAKDSFIEAEFSMAGADYKLSQMANGISRTGMVSLTKNGQAVLGNKSAGGRDEYKKWADKNLLPQNVYDAVICQSGTDSVIDLKEGPRVELLLRVLGLEIYEALAEMARKRATAVSGELNGVRARIEEIGDVDLLVLRQFVTQYGHSKQQCQGGFELKENELRLIRTKAAEIDKQRADYDAMIVRRDEMAELLKPLRERRTQLETKFQVNRELTEQKEVINNAVASIAMLEAEIAALPTRDLETTLAKEESESLQAQRELTALLRRADEAKASEDQLTERLTAIQKRIAETQAVKTDEAAIRTAVTETEGFKSELRTKWETDSEQRVREAHLAGELRDVRARFNGNAQQAAQLTRKKTEIEATVALKPRIEEAVDHVAALDRNLVTVKDELTRWRQAETFLQSKLTTSQGTRIDSLYKAHEEIHEGVSDPKARSGEAIDEDDRLFSEEGQLPGELATAKQEIVNCEVARAEFESERDRLRPLADRFSELQAAEEALVTVLAEIEGGNTLQQVLIEESNQIIARQDLLVQEMKQTQSEILELSEKIQVRASLVAQAEALATADAQLVGLREQETTATADRDAMKVTLLIIVGQADELRMAFEDINLRIGAVESKIQRNRIDINGLNAKVADLRLLADKSTSLAAAEAASDELLHQIADLDVELAALEHKHDVLEKQIDNTVLPPPVDVTAFEQAVTDARTVLNDIQARLTVAEKELTDAETKERRRQELTSQIRGLEDRFANWTLHGQHLGKDALQKEEISVAGPKLTEITNDLLRAGGDTRHTVSIETEKLHSNKKQMIPTLDINVFDSVEGLTKESKRLSDAGKILVGEPFSLALVELGCERAGITSPTIFRDEATGVFDTENAPRYIAMLRRFAERLNARVIFISQQPAIQDLADSTITIDNGTMTLK